MNEKYLVIYSPYNYKQTCDSKAELMDFIFCNLGLSSDYKIYDIKENNSIPLSDDLKNLKEKYLCEIATQIKQNKDKLSSLLNELDKVRHPIHLKNAEILISIKIEEISKSINDLDSKYEILSKKQYV